MKKILAALFCFCCSSALAQTGQELIDNGKNSENVTTFGMGYNLNQYSQLSQRQTRSGSDPARASNHCDIN